MSKTLFSHRIVNADGTTSTVAAIVAEMQKNGASQRMIDRWLQGISRYAVNCLCTETRRCEYHARQPRPCVCGGILEYISAKCGGVLVPVVSRYPRRTEEPRLVKQARAFFACNRCERCVSC